MSIAHIVTILAAAFVGFSAVSVFLRAKWIAQPLSEYGVSPSWWPWLGALKAGRRPGRGFTGAAARGIRVNVP